MQFIGLTTKGNQIVGNLVQELGFRIIKQGGNMEPAEVEAELCDLVQTSMHLGRTDMADPIVGEAILKRVQLFMFESGNDKYAVESVEYPYDVAEGLM